MFHPDICLQTPPPSVPCQFSHTSTCSRLKRIKWYPTNDARMKQSWERVWNRFGTCLKNQPSFQHVNPSPSMRHSVFKSFHPSHQCWIFPHVPDIAWCEGEAPNPLAAMRHFINQMSDLVPGSRVHVDQAHFKGLVRGLLKAIVEGMPPTFDNCGGGLYLGCAGVAYMFYYLAKSEVFSDMREELLTRARNYTEVSLSYCAGPRNRGPPTAFLLGSAGVYATGSLVYGALHQKTTVDELNMKYLALGSMCQPVDFLDSGSDELFVGRAGYLCGAMALNQQYPGVRIPHLFLINLQRKAYFLHHFKRSINNFSWSFPFCSCIIFVLGRAWYVAFCSCGTLLHTAAEFCMKCALLHWFMLQIVLISLI